MTAQNEVAERLLDFLGPLIDNAAADPEAYRKAVRDEFAAERRATVERIRERLATKWMDKNGHLTRAQWDAILDEEAARGS